MVIAAPSPIVLLMLGGGVLLCKSLILKELRGAAPPPSVSR